MSEVCVYTFDTLADWEIGHALAHLRTPTYQRTPRAYDVRLVGRTLDPITTMGGLVLTPTMTLAELSTCAMLILPGGVTWETAPDDHAEVLQKTREFLAQEVPVAAICGATGGLARAGLLAGRKHTSNAKQYLDMTGYSDGALYQEVPAVTDGPLTTASSTAPVEFAAQIFEALDLYTPEVLAAWRGLFSTGEGRYYGELMAALA